MRNKWTKDEVQYIIENYNNMSCIEISKIINHPISSIQSKILDIGLHKDHCKNTKWSDNEIEYLKNNYENNTYKEMCLYLNRTEKSIKIKAHKLGLKKSGIYFDYDKFSNITTENDAYWLGFLYADGYVIESTRSYTLGIDLQIKDIEHLRKFNKFMCGNTEINIFDVQTKLVNKPHIMCSIKYYNKYVVESLIKLGCIPKKSRKITMPIGLFNDNLMRHFIRGYFDGDGSLGRYLKRNKYTVLQASIECGSKQFLEQLKDYLANQNIHCGIGKDHTCYKMFFSGQENVRNFLDYMYKDSIIYLDRKYIKYLSFI